jgi:ketosteroid isomerase-like protein
MAALEACAVDANMSIHLDSPSIQLKHFGKARTGIRRRLISLPAHALPAVERRRGRASRPHVPCAILGREMSDEPAPPDPVALTRRALEAANSHDLDGVMSFYAPDAVWDLSDAGLGTFEGAAAIRSFIEEWWKTWGDHLIEVEEIVDLGHGVVFSPLREDGRLVGSDSHVEQRRGWVYLWGDGMVERQTAYLDVDDARAAAERLAESRG